MIIGVYFSITAILLMSIDSSKITEIQRTPSLVNRVAKPMFYCTCKPRFPIYGSSTRELYNSELYR